MRCVVWFASFLSVSGHWHGADEKGRILTFQEVGETKSAKHPLGYTEHSKTYTSYKVPLEAGEALFSNPHHTKMVFPKPGGEYAITGLKAEIVDSDGVSVPLSEVYLHHWLVFNEQSPNQGICGGFLGYKFGVGAEARGSPIEYPAGYAQFANSSDVWGINLHIFRTVGLQLRSNQSQTVKECIECWYGPGKGCKQRQNGDFACCRDGSKCPVDGSVTGSKDYHFQYTVTYSTDVRFLKPMDLVVLDASGCQIEHSIEANDVHPIHETTRTWKSPVSGRIIWSVGHVHNGGVNITLLVNNEPVCTTAPVYGTEEGVAGNEKGYLIANPPCFDTIHVKKGDKVRVSSLYWVRHGEDPTGSILPGGFHGGTMDYFTLGIDASSVSKADRESGMLEWEPHSESLAV